MDDLKNNLYINELFDIYGVLLSSSQKRMIELYYCLDLSLSEIAEQLSISRNGAYDAIKKGVESLKEYEDKLHIFKKNQNIENALEYIKEKISDEEYDIIKKYLKED